MFDPRTKYKKYKEESHKLSILIDQLQKKLKKYHDENKVLKEKLANRPESEEDYTHNNQNQSGMAFNGSQKALAELGVLKESLHKANGKALITSHGHSVATDTTGDDSRKKPGSSGFSQAGDYPPVSNEKENGLMIGTRQGPSSHSGAAAGGYDDSKYMQGSSSASGLHGDDKSPLKRDVSKNGFGLAHASATHGADKDPYSISDHSLPTGQASDWSNPARISSGVLSKSRNGGISNTYDDSKYGQTQPRPNEDISGTNGGAFYNLNNSTDDGGYSGLKHQNLAASPSMGRSTNDKLNKEARGTPEPVGGSSLGSADKDRSNDGGKKRTSVPKLKLEVLPNYHGKFNKSINHLFNK